MYTHANTEIQIHKCQTQHRWVTEKSFQLGNQIFAMAPFDPTLDPTPSSWVVGCYSQSPKMWAMPVQCCFAEIRNTSCTIGFL